MNEQTKEFEVEITEEKDQDDIHLFKIKTDATAKDVISFIGKVIDELNLKVFRTEWESKYNSYVVFDYEPYCVDGYNYIASFEYSEEVENKIAFAKRIIGDWISKVNDLNKILALTA